MWEADTPKPAKPRARRLNRIRVKLGEVLCGYCKDVVPIFGSRTDYRKRIRMGRDRKQAELPPRVCPVCVRDRLHRDLYGKYPKGSIFWELGLYDRSLR